MPALEGDEEVKEGKGLLAQIKSGNNSYKLKNEIKQILYLLYQHDCDWSKDLNDSLKHEIEFILKSNDSIFYLWLRIK